MTQDERIAANSEAIKGNAEAIRRQTEYLHEIRDYFIPGEEARFKRFAKYVVTPLVKVIALVAFIGGMWDVIAWVLARHEIRTMADRYAQVAKEVYYSENNPDVAAQFLDKAIELQDGNADYRYLRAYMQGMATTRKFLNLDRPFTKAELDRAHTAYAEALFLQNLRPSRSEPYVMKAQIFAALKETERAEEALSKALSLDPCNSFVHLRLAQVRMDRKDAAGAEASLGEALRLDPKSKWVWLWKGVFMRELKKDIVKARACYENALAIDPKFDMAWYNMGWTWMDKSSKDYAKAREAFQKALELNPDYKEACYAMGMSYGYEDNYPVAKVWMDKAVALDQAFLTAIKWRGIICGEMKDYAGAVADFDKAILLDPKNADLYVRRAKMNEGLGKADDALRDLRFALDINPGAKRTWMYLGDVYRAADNMKSALDCYEKSVAIDSGYDDALARMADALNALGRREEASAKIDAAISAAKFNKKRFLLQKAGLLASWNRLDEAVKCCVQARDVDPRYAEAWRMEAKYKKANQDMAGFKGALSEYLKLVPTDQEARFEYQSFGNTELTR